MKTPLGIWLALILAVALVWKLRERRMALAALALVPLVFFSICLMSHIAMGHRHILPVYAFFYVLAGAALAARWKFAALSVGILVVESLAIYPHYLAFFNAAAGGPRNGPAFLVDSNIDWGQDARRLGRFIAEKRLDRRCLSYFGNADLIRYGVEHSPLPRNLQEAGCVAAVSVTALKGLYVDPSSTAWLAALEPSARIGYSIYIYDLRKK